ncbi:MAG: NAD-glutamate dehydrogenase [Myxococcales bacterium]|nr:NAD-glutamate dehydrogenase [Myxococcales bacterium]
MVAQKLSNQRIQEVQKVLASYEPRLPGTDIDVLNALCKSVLNSIDVRDLKRVASEELVAQLELVLETVRVRPRGEVAIKFRRAGDQLVIESCIEDQPFLVSSVRGLLLGEGLEIRSFMNAVARVRRDAGGVITAIGKGASESVLRIEIGLGGHEPPEGLQERYVQRLRIAQAMFHDFQPMKRRLQDVADDYLRAATATDGEQSLQLRETEGMVRWLCEENYVLLSVEEYDLDGAMISGLGVCRILEPNRPAATMAEYGKPVGATIRFSRSREESPVHRAGKPGHFMIQRVDRGGAPTGTILVNGLFTYKALHTPPEEIPLLRVILREHLRDREVSIDSHRGKSITNAFNSLPLEFLLTEPRASIWDLTDRVLRAEAEGESDVHIRVGEDSRFVFTFVSLPKEMFSDELRLQVQDLLMREFGATYADFGVYMDRYDNAIVHYYLTGPDTFGSVDTESVRERVLALARGWNERLREVLRDVCGAERADELFELYVDAFTDEAKRRTGDSRLRGDVACIETLRGGEDFDCDLFVSTTGDHPGTLNLRVFKRQPINLSDELPLVTSFGFSVIDEYRRPITLAHERVFEMDNFRLDVRPERIPAILGRRKEIRAAMRDVFSGKLGRDRLNQLIVTTTLTATEVEVARAYVAYLHQLRCPFETDLLRSVLVAYPTVTQALMSWLASRFDPATASDENAKVADATLRRELKGISDYTADRVFSAVAEVVRATRRTNAFLERGADEGLAIKVSGQKISFGPEPRPYREIWVYHQEFEGVHLRGGPVARGGLRFSDRPNDFRTEIHGLMATQRVKNVLIVPVGAKGGFVLRNPPGERAALRAAGDHFYELFVRSLLSLTDNVIDGQPVTPPGVLHSESPDPYLVVAADKGTAHLSDTANAISQGAGFWLGDAFASGGSYGYDHKATGITARGAWETTIRHFHELGVDPEADVITAAGVGDMGGDVFGNGLLRSRTVKLLAAFNHIEIFLDPDPDPEVSFKERARLFSEVKSWADYDRALLSAGGGVWPRDAKAIELAPAACELLGVPAGAQLSGEEVIRKILLLQVDLMWMGGIGTYIKGKDESHAEVGDKANDSVRVDAHQLRCRVLAEGANLAITDRGRAEFARMGGQNYTSFLDNSGGVDISDHEVNIKILFAPLLASGTVTLERRNELLSQCKEQVCEMVLANNRSQSRMVSYDARRSRKDVYRYSRALSYLIAEVPFNPDVFGLPTEDELATRARKGGGLYKCDASALGAYAKMLAYRQLMMGDALPENLMDRMLRAYFPPAILDEVGDALGDHLLRRELATTMTVNRIIDNAGATFFAEVITGTRRSPAEIAWAYVHAADAGNVDALQAELYACEDKHRQEVIYEAMEALQSALEEATYYLLDHGTPASFEASTVTRAQAILEAVEEILPKSQAATLARRSGALTSRGLPEPLARRVVRVEYLTSVLESIRMADETGRNPDEIMRLHLEVASEMHIHTLQEAISRLVFDSPWEGLAASALSRQLTFHLHKMVRSVEGDDVPGMIRRLRLEDVRRQGLRSVEAGVTIAALVMYDHHLRRLLPAMPGGYRGYTDTFG